MKALTTTLGITGKPAGATGDNVHYVLCTHLETGERYIGKTYSCSKTSTCYKLKGMFPDFKATSEWSCSLPLTELPNLRVKIISEKKARALAVDIFVDSLKAPKGIK